MPRSIVPEHDTVRGGGALAKCTLCTAPVVSSLVRQVQKVGGDYLEEGGQAQPEAHVRGGVA